MFACYRTNTRSLLALPSWIGSKWKNNVRHFCIPSTRPDKWKVLFFGTDHISLPTLDALYAKPDLVSDISVVCPPDSRLECAVKQYATKKGLPIYQPNAEELQSFQAPQSKDGESYDIAIAVSYGHLIPSHLLSSLSYGGINMHPSILPFYRGPAPLIRQLELGERVGGISVIELHPSKFDMGRIFLQWVFSIPSTIQRKDFEEGVSGHGAHAIITVLDRYNEYRAKLSDQPSASEPIEVKEEIPNMTPLDKLLYNQQALSVLPSFPKGKTFQCNDMLYGTERPTYARLLKSNDGNINWEENSAIQVYNKWRAFGKKPGCFTFLRWPPGSRSLKRVKLITVEEPKSSTVDVDEPRNPPPPGTVTYCKTRKIVVIHTKNAGDPIYCTELQVEGKKVGDAMAFFTGFLGAFPKKTSQFCMGHPEE